MWGCEGGGGEEGEEGEVGGGGGHWRGEGGDGGWEIEDIHKRGKETGRAEKWEGERKRRGGIAERG